MRVTFKFTFQNNFSLSNLCLTVLQLTNSLAFSLIQFSSPGYYQQKKIKLMLEQYLKLDQRSESINYHCIILWSSLVLIIWADKFVASKIYNLYNFHLDDQNYWCLLIVLDNKHWLLSEKPCLLAHFYDKIIDSLLYTNKLSVFVNSWDQFQMLERILNLSLFGKISKGRNGFNYALSLWETMLACKVTYIHYEYNVRIIVLNSLRNKYAECNKDFSPQQVKAFYKNWEAFLAFCNATLDINNIS